MDLCLFFGLTQAFLGFISTFVTGNHPCKCSGDKVPWILLLTVVGAVNFCLMVAAVKLLPIFLANIFLNTAPFFASLFAFFFVGEAIHWVEIVCMVGAFTGVVVIATSPAPIDKTLEHKLKLDITKHKVGAPVSHLHAKLNSTKRVEDTEYKLYIVGVICMIITAVGFGFNASLSRKLKGIHFTIIETYYGTVGFICVSMFLIIEYFITNFKHHKPMRLFTYDAKTYGYALAASFSTYIMGNAITIARQSYNVSFV